MREMLQQETDKLVRSWAQHDPSWLNSYLVAGVEDPRVNVQSILTRHFLIRELSGDRYTDLMAQEYRFAAALNWLLKLGRPVPDAEEMASILFALKRGADNAEGMELPLFLVQTFANLPCIANDCSIPNYIESFLAVRALPPDWPKTVEPILNTFQRLWRQTLGAKRSVLPQSAQEVSRVTNPETRPSLLEPACGSANDYRFLAAYGIAPWFDYTGFDLCVNNIENARALFPQIRFETGNVFEIQAPDKSYDLCIVQDLLEHLSLEGMHTAVDEICRVTRRGICLGFFQMDEIRDHLVRPTEDYYWNLLSMRKMRELFAQHGFTGEVFHLGTFLDHQVGCEETHNPNAYTFQLRARPLGSGGL